MECLNRVYQGEYSVYQRDAMYCFLRGICEQETLTLAGSFKAQGQYLFCPVSVEDTEAFVENGIAYFKQWNRKLQFLWIENPNEPYFLWKCNWLEAACRNQQLFFGSYRFLVGAWDSLDVQEEDFVFSYKEKGQYGFFAHKQYAMGSSDTLKLGTVGKLCGTFRGSLFLSKEESGSFFETADIGIHYARIMDESEESAWENGYVAHVLSRVFIAEEAVSMEFMLTPQSLTDETRTQFLLTGNHFRTLLSSITGEALSVTAKEGAALVFEENPILAYLDENGNVHTRKVYYLGISGRFMPKKERVKLLCGLTGTEYLQLGKEACLNFTPHKPAIYDGADNPEGLGSTSWIEISGGCSYYCQPDTASLYAMLSTYGLRCFEVPVASYEAAAPAVPILPFREIMQSFPMEFRALEKHLYRERWKLLIGRNRQHRELLVDENVRAVTPQGMIVEVASTGKYNWIGFVNVSGTGSVPDLCFQNISEKLQYKFQEKELLYIIDSADELREAGPSDGFCFFIDGIGFSLLPKDWRKQGNNPTLLIIKYSAEKSIAEERTQYTALDTAIRNAYTNEGSIKDGYEEFIHVVENKEFRGILAIHVTVSMKQLPAEVQFLMSGVPADRFYASYLILKAGRLKNSHDAGIVLEQSGISGLIDYTAEKKLCYETQPPDYDYLTTKIRIQLQNSRILSFTSSSEVLVNRLFEAPALARENPDGNCLVLEGRMVEKDGAKAYQYHLKQCVKFELEGSGICNVWIQDIVLTVNSSLEGLFAMSGVLSCSVINGADLLGYGGEHEEEGLPFSQLVLRKADTIAMDYGLLYFDAQRAVVRKGSFPDRFGAYFDFIILETSGKTPEQKGFLPINAPISQGVPAAQYQGIVWNIPVGSLGELSGQSGICLKLMLAFWCDTEGTTQYYAGVKLPGALSSDVIKLQGIFKLGFGAISLEKQEKDYLMKLHNFHMEILGASFPKGSSDIYLFSDGDNVGWYAAYQEEQNG